MATQTKSRPTLEDTLIMTVAKYQRKKVGISRVAIKREIVETHGYSDEKRTVTKVTNLIKALLESGVLENTTPQSFHLTEKGLDQSREIRASKVWKKYQISLKETEEDGEEEAPAVEKSTTTKKTRKAKAAEGGEKGKKKGEEDGQAKSKTTKTSGEEGKTRAKPKTKPAKVFYDAVMEKDPATKVMSRAEREEMREKRKAELATKRATEGPKRRGRGASGDDKEKEESESSPEEMDGSVSEEVVAEVEKGKAKESGKKAAPAAQANQGVTPPAQQQPEAKAQPEPTRQGAGAKSGASEKGEKGEKASPQDEKMEKAQDKPAATKAKASGKGGRGCKGCATRK